MMKHYSEDPNGLKTLATLEEIIFSISNKQDLESLESEYLNTITHLIPAHATAFYLFQPDRVEPKRISARGVDRDFLLYYEKQGRDLDPLRHWITRQKTPNQSQVLLGLEGWQHHPVYNIVGAASIDFAMQSPIVNGSDVIATLNFGRDQQEGPFSSSDLKAVSIISRFLSMAIAKSMGNSEKSFLNKALCYSIDQVPHGILITDSDYTVQYANSAAKKHSARHTPESDVSDILKQNASHQGKYGHFNHDELSAKYCPIPGSNRQHAIVFIETEKPLNINPALRTLLTTREIDVLKLVDKGMSNKEMAEYLNISVNTIKRHLDNLYGKIQVNSRTQLISKIYKINAEQM